MDKKKPGGNPWLKILGIAIIIIAFFVLFDVELIVEYISNTDWFYLGFAFFLLLLSYLMAAIRLSYMLGNRPEVDYTFHATNAANMMNLITFIPVTLIKIFLMGQHKKVDTPQATSALTIGVIFDMAFKIISLLGVILILMQTISVGQVLVVSGVLILLIIGLFSFLKTKAESIINKGTPLLGRLPVINEDQAHGAITSFMDGLEIVGEPLNLIITTLWSLLIWVGSILFYYLGLLAIGIDLPPHLMLAGGLSATFVVNPLMPYLPGVYHGLLVTALYIVVQANEDSLVALAVVLSIGLLVFWFGLGILGLRTLDFKFSEFREQISTEVQQMRHKN